MDGVKTIKALLISCVSFLFGGLAFAVPKIHFQDLLSAPVGAYVTVWGEAFGTSPGQVLVDGKVAEVTVWSDRQIVFRQPDSDKPEYWIVDASGQRSSQAVLAKTEGNIYYISAARGSDDNDGLSQPLQTINAFVQRSKPGDVAYVRAGNYEELGDEVYDAHIFINPQFSGTNDKPVSLVAFPGETPVVGSDDHRFGIMLFGDLKNWTVSKLHFRGHTAAVMMSTIGVRENIRIVGNIAQEQYHANGVFQLNSTHNLQVLGNQIKHGGIRNNKFSHLIYYAGFGPGSNVTIGWNQLSDQVGGRCIQVYGHHPADFLEGLRIENNILDQCRLDGILVGGSDDRKTQDWIKDAAIQNNHISNVQESGIRINAEGIKADVIGNTIQSSNVGILLSEGKVITVKSNNIIAPEGRPAIVVEKPEHLSMDNNTFQ